MELTTKNRHELGKLIIALYDNANKEPKEHVEIHIRYGKGFTFDADGRNTMAEAVKKIQTVPEWNKAYPADAIHNRIIDSMFEGGEIADIVQRIIDGLNADCKAIRAYVAFTGFHLDPGIEIKIGKFVLRVLGQSGVEDEIIGRLNQHMDAANFPQTEDEREKERERYRNDLAKHANLPILVVEYHGSVEGAKDVIAPIGEYVGLFIQFCIGALTDRFFDDPIIVDYRGRFTGEFAFYMPVMTVEFDRFSMPNLRGNPWGCQLTTDDITKLGEWGVLDLADDFLDATANRKGMRNLLVRAMAAFADGERAISKLSRMSSYVTATEIFFSQRYRTTIWVTNGIAATNAEKESDFGEVLELAEAVYEERSRSLHEGVEPALVYRARKLARGSILRMISMQDTLKTRKGIRKWLTPRIPPETTCPRCGAPVPHENGD